MFVLVRHDGFEALYAHLGSVTPALAEGKRHVAAGEKIGVRAAASSRANGR